MKPLKTFQATDREAWRAWLAENHASEREVWLVYAKKHTGVRCISYEESVEEALCHGWIDSLIRRIDDDSYARKFTPRTNNDNWSALNTKRVAKVIREGRMTAIGLAKMPKAKPQPKSKPEVQVAPALIESALKADAKAWANFSKMPPSHKRRYISWISLAKREETRQKRLREAIRMLTKNVPLGLK